MAALQTKEDSMTGRLTLFMPSLPRLGRILFGLVWLVFIGAFLISDTNGDAENWGMVLFFFAFALLPLFSSALNALVNTTIVIDRGTRTLSLTKQLLSLPISAQAIPFSDVTGIELLPARTQRQFLWLVNAVTRDAKRVRLNWDGGEKEMDALAQKISALVGAPVTQAPQVPAVAQPTLEPIAPNAQELRAPSPADDSTATSPSDVSTTAQPATAAAVSIDSTPDIKTTPSAALNALSIDTLEKRIADDTLDSDARYVLARKYHARGQIDKAIGLYQDTLRLDPTNVNAQNNLGVALQQRGKRAEAEAAYRRAIALDPFSTTAHLNLGLLLRSMNRAAEASQEFFQARQNARGDAETRMAEAASTGGRIEPQMSKA